MNFLSILSAVFTFLNGKKTYLASAGFLVLAIIQLIGGQYLTAFQSFMAALGAVGVRHAISKHSDAMKQLTDVINKK